MLRASRLTEEVTADKAAQECLSEEALAQLATYKYSSVDNSLLTHFVLRHYVRIPDSLPWLFRFADIMDSGTASSNLCHYGLPPTW